MWRLLSTEFLRALGGCSQRSLHLRFEGFQKPENLKSQKSLRTPAECAETCLSLESRILLVSSSSYGSAR